MPGRLESMGKWFKQFEAIIWAATIIAISIVWAYQSFATIAYVDKKHESVMEVMKDVQSHVLVIDQRTYELARDAKR